LLGFLVCSSDEGQKLGDAFNSSAIPHNVAATDETTMSKLRVNRVHYRSGRIHRESRLKGGILHGVSRTWHRNGQLALEERYRNGKLHGLCRAWKDNGVPLGEFVMVNGTGVQRAWHNNGQVRLEITTLEGRFHGRVRSWLRDGSLAGEDFYISGDPVSRAVYLKAAQRHPEWPQYASEPKSKLVRPNRKVELNEHEGFVQSMFDGSSVIEAKEWLSESKAGTRRARKHLLGKFRSAAAASRFVAALYSAGATEVYVAGIHQGRKPGVFADWMLVGLPKSKTHRGEVRVICRELSVRTGAGFEPERDIGESYLFGLLA
jgi:hypothetical protein